MANDAHFRLEVEGCSTPLRVTRIAGVERVHEAARMEVDLQALDGALDVEAVVDQRASLEIGDATPPRVFHGIVDAVEETGEGYRVTLAPRLALLADAVDHRVFLAQDAVAVASEVMRGHGLDLEVRVSRSLAPRAQCVQAFESDLDFVRRILAEEGVLLHVAHEGGKDTVVLGDHPGAYDPLPGEEEIPFSEAGSAGLAGAEIIRAARLVRARVPDKITLRDFDFEKPKVDQTTTAGDGPIERYEFPGGYVDPGQGGALAQIRLEEAQARKIVLRGTTTSRRLSPGHVFKLAGGQRDELEGRWLILEVTHRGSDFHAAMGAERTRYEADFVAVPAAAPHRPARLPRPSLGGVQSATVTGAAGAEIHTEGHGRIKALFRWDRLRSRDDHSSHWLRPVQPPTSGGFFLPRTGWEVLVGFSGTSGDAPYELGRLYNASAPPPEGLPGKKVRSAFGSLTTPGGGSANLLRMDDAAGAEGMTLNASKDYNERTENDKDTTVKGDDLHVVGADHTDIVGILSGVTVDGAQTYSVGATRDLTTTGNYTIEAASESVAVGGLRLFQIGGDYETQAGTLTRAVGGLKAEVAIQEVNRHVTGVSTVLVGGGWTEIGGLTASTSVLGASVLNVGGAISVKAKEYSLKASAFKESYGGSRSIKAGAKRVEATGGPAKYTVGGSMKLEGSAVVFKADAKITLKASGCTVTITPSAIKVSGDFDSSEASVVTGEETND